MGTQESVDRIEGGLPFICADYKHNSEQENVIDLLTDLRLWCDAKGVDFNSVVNTSYDHYVVEKGE